MKQLLGEVTIKIQSIFHIYGVKMKKTIISCILKSIDRFQCDVKTEIQCCPKLSSFCLHFYEKGSTLERIWKIEAWFSE